MDLITHYRLRKYASEEKPLSSNNIGRTTAGLAGAVIGAPLIGAPAVFVGGSSGMALDALVNKLRARRGKKPLNLLMPAGIIAGGLLGGGTGLVGGYKIGQKIYGE